MESNEMCEATATNYLPGDPELIDKIVFQLKLQGLFDEFRKECLADVDTKPAYQNLRQRVDNSVASFLNRTTWCASLNKKNVRENLRKHVYDCRFLDTGLERIVEQVVNPKICSVFYPKVEEVVYKFLGIPIEAKPEAESASTSNKLPTGAEKGKSSRFKGEPHNLLPEELEPISPDHNGLSDNENTDKSKGEKKATNSEDKTKDIKKEILSPAQIKEEGKEEDTSPMFEPHHGKKDSDSEMSGISDMLSHSSPGTPKKPSSPEAETLQAEVSAIPEVKVEKVESVTQDLSIVESEPMIDASAISPLTSSSVGSASSPREKILFSEKMFDETCASYISIKSANEGQFDDESSDSDGYERLRITYSPKTRASPSSVKENCGTMADGKKSGSDIETSSVDSRNGWNKDNGRGESPAAQLSQEDCEELSLPKTPTIHYDNAEFESVNELQESIKKTQEKSVEDSSVTSSEDSISKGGAVQETTENSNLCLKQIEESSMSIDTENSLSGKENLIERKKQETQKLYERNSKESERKHSYRSHSSRKDSGVKEHHTHSSKSSRDASKECKEKSSKDGRESSQDSRENKSSKDSKEVKVQKVKEVKPAKEDSSKDKQEHSPKVGHSPRESHKSKDSKHYSRDSKHSSKHRSKDSIDKSVKDHHRSSSKDNYDKHKSSKDADKKSKDVPKDEGKDKNPSDKSKEEKKTEKINKDRKNKDQCSSRTSSRDRDSRRSSDRDNDGSSSIHRHHKSSQNHSTSETSRKEDPSKKSTQKHSSSTSKSSDSSESSRVRIVFPVLKHSLPNVNVQYPSALADASSSIPITKSESQGSISNCAQGSSLIVLDKTPKVILERCSLEVLRSPPMNVAGSHASIFSLASSFNRIREDTDLPRMKKPRNAANFVEAKKILEQQMVEKHLLSEQSKREVRLQNKPEKDLDSDCSVSRSEQTFANSSSECESGRLEPPGPKKRKIAANIFQSLDKPKERRMFRNFDSEEVDDEIVPDPEYLAKVKEATTGTRGPTSGVSPILESENHNIVESTFLVSDEQQLVVENLISSECDRTTERKEIDSCTMAVNQIEKKCEIIAKTENNECSIETESDQNRQQIRSEKKSEETEGFRENGEDDYERNSELTKSEQNIVKVETDEIEYTECSTEVEIGLNVVEMNTEQNISTENSGSSILRNIACSNEIETAQCNTEVEMLNSHGGIDHGISSAIVGDHGCTSKTANFKNSNETEIDIDTSQKAKEQSGSLIKDESLAENENGIITETMESLHSETLQEGNKNQIQFEEKPDANVLEMNQEQNSARTEINKTKQNLETPESIEKMPVQEESLQKSFGMVSMEIKKDEDSYRMETQLEENCVPFCADDIEVKETTKITKSQTNTLQSANSANAEQKIEEEDNLSAFTKEIEEEGSEIENPHPEPKEASSIDVEFELTDELKLDPKALLTKLRSFLVHQFKSFSKGNIKSLEQIPAQDFINQQFLNFVNNFQIENKHKSQKSSISSDYIDIDSSLEGILRDNNFQIERQYYVSVPETSSPCWVYNEEHDCLVLKEEIPSTVSSLKRRGRMSINEDTPNQMRAKRIKICGISSGELQVSHNSVGSQESSVEVPGGVKMSVSEQASTELNRMDIQSLSTSSQNIDSISSPKYDGDCSTDDGSILSTPNKSLTAQLIEPALESLLAESGLAPLVPGGKQCSSPRIGNSEEKFNLPLTPESESVQLVSNPLKGNKRHSGESNTTTRKKSSPVSGKNVPPMKQRNALVESSQGKLQRYDSSDLYKPRPLFSQTSRRARSNNLSTRDSIGVENESANALNSNVVTRKR